MLYKMFQVKIDAIIVVYYRTHDIKTLQTA